MMARSMLNFNVMENKLSSLNTLEELVKKQKQKSLWSLQSKFSKHHVSSICDNILKMIDELKDSEKEQSRLDWKEGYLECCLDVAEFFGNERDESHPTESEMQEIEEQSFEYVKRKK